MHLNKLITMILTHLDICTDVSLVVMYIMRGAVTLARPSGDSIPPSVSKELMIDRLPRLATRAWAELGFSGTRMMGDRILMSSPTFTPVCCMSST